jgi:hypothetical protein
MFTLLYNTLAALDRLPEGQGKAFENFDDHGDVASWAVPAMRYLVENGIIVGGAENKLFPHRGSFRAEMTTLLYHILGNE